MVEIKVAKKWFVPYGNWIILSHSEACNLTTAIEVADIARQIVGIGNVWVQLAATAIKFQSDYIRKKNEDSGGKGVKLLFVWAVGVITSIERRGSGRSPCGGTPTGTAEGGGYSGGTPTGTAGGGGRSGSIPTRQK